MRWRGRSGDRGVAAVELALVLPPLLMLLFGIVEFGRVYSMKSLMEHVARDAARVIALEHDDPDMTQEDLENRVDAVLTNGLGDLNDSVVRELIVYCTSGDAVVELSLTVDLAIPDGGALDPVTVTATAKMPCEG